MAFVLSTSCFCRDIDRSLVVKNKFFHSRTNFFVFFFKPSLYASY